jgi:hypothetical protein
MSVCRSVNARRHTNTHLKVGNNLIIIIIIIITQQYSDEIELLLSRKSGVNVKSTVSHKGSVNTGAVFLALEMSYRLHRLHSCCDTY